MKIYSNIPIPKVLKWKGNQMFISINHKENTVKTEEDEGKKFEADFTIVDELTESAAIYAFSRSVNNPDLDNKVIYNIQENNKSAIEVKEDYLTKVSSTLFQDLIADGTLVKDKVIAPTDPKVIEIIKG